MKFDVRRSYALRTDKSLRVATVYSPVEKREKKMHHFMQCVLYDSRRYLIHSYARSIRKIFDSTDKYRKSFTITLVAQTRRKNAMFCSWRDVNCSNVSAKHHIMHMDFISMSMFIYDKIVWRRGALVRIHLLADDIT